MYHKQCPWNDVSTAPEQDLAHLVLKCLREIRSGELQLGGGGNVAHRAVYGSPKPFPGMGPCYLFRLSLLRGPAAILFISRDTCSDSIAKLFRACFYGASHSYRVIRCKMGYRTDVYVCVKLSTKGGIAPFCASANLP